MYGSPVCVCGVRCTYDVVVMCYMCAYMSVFCFCGICVFCILCAFVCGDLFCV